MGATILTSYKIEDSDSYRHIEKLTTIAILQILNEYRKIFQGSESAD
jgi:hypothetical protein